MRVLRSLIACCLLLALPVQQLAAFTGCCPADTAGAHAAPHAGMAHAGADAASGHAGHPCDEAAAGTASQDDCDGARCALHCAHAPTLSVQAGIRPSPARSGPHFPAPAVAVDEVAATPRLRPPIFAHC